MDVLTSYAKVFFTLKCSLIFILTNGYTRAAATQQATRFEAKFSSTLRRPYRLKIQMFLLLLS